MSLATFGALLPRRSCRLPATSQYPAEITGDPKAARPVIRLRRTLGSCDLPASDVVLLSQDFAYSARVNAVVGGDFVLMLTAPGAQPNVHSFFERKLRFLQYFQSLSWTS